jgi:hypothetical protein
MPDQRDEQWGYSTEGDLDPDLTEEAGYLDWEPSPHRGRRLLLWAGLVAALIAMVGGALLVLWR